MRVQLYENLIVAGQMHAAQCFKAQHDVFGHPSDQQPVFGVFVKSAIRDPDHPGSKISDVRFIEYFCFRVLFQQIRGKIVFFQGGANFLTMIKENAPSVYEKTDVTEQIKGPVGQNDFSVMNFVIPLRAKYKKEALDFCLYLTNAENQLELAKMTNVIATNNKALSDSFYNDYSTLESKARSISAKQINKISPQLKQRRNQKEINTLVNTAVQSALLNKDSTEHILSKLEKDIKEIDE